jgi:hypothetical protein
MQGHARYFIRIGSDSVKMPDYMVHALVLARARPEADQNQRNGKWLISEFALTPQSRA